MTLKTCVNIGKSFSDKIKVADLEYIGLINQTNILKFYPNIF